MSEENEKKLRVMRFWVIGVFLIIVAAAISVGFAIPGLIRELYFWLGVGLAAVLCAAWYLGYRAWIKRKT